MPPRDQYGAGCSLFAMLNYGVFIVFSTEVQVYLPASEAIVLTYTLPIWASLLALASVVGRASVMAAISGVGPGDRWGGAAWWGLARREARWEQLHSVAMGLTAAVLFGLGTVLAKRTPLALPPATSVAWQVGFGTAVVAVLAAFETADWNRVTPAGWACITYVATVPMTIAYLAWFRALRLVPASTAATTVLVSPMVGVLGGTLVLGEPLGPRQIVALGLTLTGVALAARG